MPQGGILSPLLANVVLNELDRWIARQRELPKHIKNSPAPRPGTTLWDVAVRLFEGTKLWLKERLGLEASPEKSKIVYRKNSILSFWDPN